MRTGVVHTEFAWYTIFELEVFSLPFYDNVNGETLKSCPSGLRNWFWCYDCMPLSLFAHLQIL